jgi:hypothetical protein
MLMHETKKTFKKNPKFNMQQKTLIHTTKNLEWKSFKMYDQKIYTWPQKKKKQD